MGKQNLNRIITMCLIAIMVVVTFPISVKADVGPKPSLDIQIKGVDDREFYYTVLSSDDKPDPIMEWYEPSGEEIKINEIFSKYQDSDDFYFPNRSGVIGKSEEKNIYWMYPPEKYKVILYFPDEKVFVESNTCSSYAFESYFVMDLSEVSEKLDKDKGLNDQVYSVIMQKNYDYTGEIESFGIRILLTLLIELIIALIFKYWEKKQLLVIMLTNVLTQLILNISINIYVYYNGFDIGSLIILFLGEIGVLIIESVIFCLLLNKVAVKKIGKKWAILRALGYAIIANAATYAVTYLSIFD